MTGRFKPGQLVTILPPYGDDPIVVELQPHGRIGDVVDDGYMVVLGSVWPPDRQFGPFPAGRLAPGWRNSKTGADWVR